MTLGEAIKRFEADLPDWWWLVGKCSVSCNASCGPDRNGRDAHLLGNRQFDEGFHADLLDGGTAEALDDVRHQALIARKEVSDDATQAEEG